MRFPSKPAAQFHRGTVQDRDSVHVPRARLGQLVAGEASEVTNAQ
jgi:hypothetical protein